MTSFHKDAAAMLAKNIIKMANIAEKVEVDIEHVRQGIRSDKRISY